MLERFYPNEYVNSVEDIDFDMYYKQGIRGVIFDIDNTLVPHGHPATDKSIEFFEKLRKIGLDTCLISNNQEPRVEPFAYAVKSKYIFDAHKPSTRNYKKAMELMHTDVDSTIFVGDQIFTDTLGGNLYGVKTVLLDPIKPESSARFKFKRKLERAVYKIYNIKNTEV